MLLEKLWADQAQQGMLQSSEHVGFQHPHRMAEHTPLNLPYPRLFLSLCHSQHFDLVTKRPGEPARQHHEVHLLRIEERIVLGPKKQGVSQKGVEVSNAK